MFLFLFLFLFLFVFVLVVWFGRWADGALCDSDAPAGVAFGSGEAMAGRLSLRLTVEGWTCTCRAICRVDQPRSRRCAACPCDSGGRTGTSGVTRARAAFAATDGVLAAAVIVRPSVRARPNAPSPFKGCLGKPKWANRALEDGIFSRDARGGTRAGTPAPAAIHARVGFTSVGNRRCRVGYTPEHTHGAKDRE